MTAKQLITAAQWIYANVEAKDSPSRKHGFQTLFYTTDEDPGGLSTRELLDLEATVSQACENVRADKHLFLHTPSGKVALVRVVALQGTDRHNRGARLLAHAL